MPNCFTSLSAPRRRALAGLFAAALSACGGGGDSTGTAAAPAPAATPTPAPTPAPAPAPAGGAGGTTTSPTSSPIPTAANTTGVYCAVSASGTQLLAYTNTPPGGSLAVSETLPFNYTWSCGAARSLVANGVPNHAVANGRFASKLSEQSISVSMPVAATGNTVATGLDVPGYALNGVKFDPGTGGTCPDSATSDANCNYNGNTGTWRMEAIAGSATPWRFDFGTDASNAHVQPTGQYHYHGMPEGLLPKLNTTPTTRMTLVGWAMDGYPIYARYGYSTAGSAASALAVMRGSYRTKAAPDANRPSTTSFAMGHFRQDWEYVASSGDLDECNGRTGVTPEFPQGVYHYFVTDTYPYVGRCLKGKV